MQELVIAAPQLLIPSMVLILLMLLGALLIALRSTAGDERAEIIKALAELMPWCKR
ncbi:hypothetical protein [Streptomyces murinus]|uniref:hypothetical protein n=1 Tax=Streptomyces murinus TaxID=33900 RepID=UPI0038257E60